jgi:hypothetical protein
MMYAEYIMRRTQIYLDERQSRLLESQSSSTGQSISHLIRAAIDAVYGKRRSLTRVERARLARATAGAWRSHAESGTEYVERIRGAGRLDRAVRAR